MGAGARESTQGLAVLLTGIFLARHGETDYNLGRRFQGVLPVPLNETGRRQAAELAELAAPHDFHALWCSPLTRARETADIVGARIGLKPIEDARLVETDAGDWTDRWWSDVEKEDPTGLAAFIRSDPDFAFPGGESYHDQTVRSVNALRDIASGPKPALVVCHAMVIRLVVMHLGRGNHPVQNGALIEL
ncbi:MAG TPA: histidine phosphatase family protein [Solirubrobacteraceae bacterium]|nr:histidine phosphatase family protein [Solirubrobacteraceae bacterium]